MIKYLEESLPVIDKILKTRQELKIRIKLIKNKKILIDTIQNLKDTYNSILACYGEIQKDRTVKFKNNKDQVEAFKQISELNNLFKNIDITLFNYTEIKEIDKLTDQDLEKIIFMIEDK